MKLCLVGATVGHGAQDTRLTSEGDTRITQVHCVRCGSRRCGLWSRNKGLFYLVHSGVLRSQTCYNRMKTERTRTSALTPPQALQAVQGDFLPLRRRCASPLPHSCGRHLWARSSAADVLARSANRPHCLEQRSRWLGGVSRVPAGTRRFPQHGSFEPMLPTPCPTRPVEVLAETLEDASGSQRLPNQARCSRRALLHPHQW